MGPESNPNVRFTSKKTGNLMCHVHENVAVVLTPGKAMEPTVNSF